MHYQGCGQLGRRLVPWAAAACLPVLLACCSAGRVRHGPEATFETQPEAGTVHVGIQSVAPFEEYLDQLQPTFTLTAEQALDKAIPDTQLEELKSLRSILVRLALALPTKTETITDTTTTTDGVETSNRVEEAKETPGTATPAALPTAVAALDQLAFDSTPSTTLDPVLRYKAAAALYQEVALLSTYVRDAAVARGTTPYIGRLLITVLPSARREPYDVYSSISFFSSGGAVVYKTDTTPLYDVRGEYSYELRQAAERRIENSLAELVAEPVCAQEPIETIPLFVTDNLEASILSSSSRFEEDFGASASLPVGNTGLGVNAGTRGDESRRSLGRDLNALFTVGRASPETIEVRLGAAAVEGGHQTLARTYNLTALLLVKSGPVGEFERKQVAATLEHLSSRDLDAIRATLLSMRAADPGGTSRPESPRLTDFEEGILRKLAMAVPKARQEALLACTHVRFTAFSSFRHSRTGVALANPRGPAMLDEVRAIDARLAQASQAAVDAVEQNDFTGFMSSSGLQLPIAEALWPRAVSIARRHGLTAGDFEAPPPTSQLCPPTRDGLVAFDDGKSLSVSVHGAQGLNDKRLFGRLRLMTAGGEELSLTNTSLAIGRDGTAKFGFPSALALGAALKTESRPAEKFEVADLEVSYQPLALRWAAGPATTSVCRAKATIASTKKEPDPEAGFSLRVPTQHITPLPDGTGEIAVELRAPTAGPKAVHVAIDGAFISEVVPAIARTGADYVLPTNAAYTLKLRNLLAGSMVTIRSWRKEGDKEVPATPATLLVLRGEEKPESTKK